MYSGVTQRHRRRGRHTADIEERGEDHAGFDRHRQVRQHGQRKGDAPYRGFRRAQLDDVRDLAPLAHVVRHDR